MPEIIMLPMSHYFDRYRKAFIDMNAISGHLMELEEQVAFFKVQKKMATEELATAERALRSAVMNSAPAQEAEIPEPVVKVLQAVESLQPKPPDPDKDKGAS